MIMRQLIFVILFIAFLRSDAQCNDMVILSGTAHPELAASVASELKVPPTAVKIGMHKDQESWIAIQGDVRHKSVYLIQPTSAPANHTLMELLLLLDALKRSSAGHITVCMPYFGFARQDRQTEPGAPTFCETGRFAYENSGGSTGDYL